MNPALTPLTTLALLTVALAGCTIPGAAPADCWQDVDTEFAPSTNAFAATHDFEANDQTLYADAGFDGDNWPDLTGHELVILDHGAFDYAFDAAKPLFEELTGATVTNIAASDAGSALQQAIDDRNAGSGTFDVIYGIDNVLLSKALEANIFDPYTPLLGEHVADAHRFTPDGVWPATPVDYGFIAVNGDPRHNITLDSLDDLVAQAETFATMDPRFSSPGLGFLVATVATYGEECYLGYWNDLFDGGVRVTQGWTEGYVSEFTGGYGQWDPSFAGDKHLITSYTTSPAYEMYYGYDVQNEVLLAPQATFKQIQTMGILQGADRMAAEAWIEFTLTDAFQNLAAEYNAIYPVVENDATTSAVNAVYGNADPQPGTFIPAALDYAAIGAGVDEWVADWVDLYEAHAS